MTQVSALVLSGLNQKIESMIISGEQFEIQFYFIQKIALCFRREQRAIKLAAPVEIEY